MPVIIVASTNEIKLRATRIACARVFTDILVKGKESNSRVSEQPEGVETFVGCKNRLVDILNLPNSDECWNIAIENGIFRLWGFWYIDKAVVQIKAPGQPTVQKISKGVVFPNKYVKIARERGFDTTTVGSVIAEITGCNKADPHAYLTKGRVTREELLISTIYEALQEAVQLVLNNR